MKHLMLVFFIATAFVACKSTKAQTQDEQYFYREISQDSANILQRNYAEDKNFKNAFRDGMFIPIKVIDELRKTEGLTGFSIYYGKYPPYLTPVFLIYGTKDGKLEYKNAAPANPPATNTYIVYYPCPTQCR